MRPSAFSKQYLPLRVRTESGEKQVSIKRYLSDEPRTKEWTKQAFWDFECFVKRMHRYEPSKGNYSGFHELYGNAFASPSLVGGAVPVSWKTMSLCYYGKGRPEDFANTLSVVAYYLNHAKLPLNYLGWNRIMPVEEYGWWYFGLDCNGFAGAYYQVNFPHTGVDGNDHINVLDNMKFLAKRTSFAEMRDGDLLVREGSKGGNTRHVAVIESILPLTDKRAAVIATQSSNSKGGLVSEPMFLESVSGDSDNYGPIKWKLVGYHSFHHVLGPK